MASDTGGGGSPLVERMILTEEHDGTWRVTVSGSDVDRAATVTNATADPVEIADQVLKHPVTLRHLFRPAPARLHGGAVAATMKRSPWCWGPPARSRRWSPISRRAVSACSTTNRSHCTPPTASFAAFTRPLVCKPAGAVHLPEPLATTWASRRDVAGSAPPTWAPVTVWWAPALVVIARRDAASGPRRRAARSSRGGEGPDGQQPRSARPPPRRPRAFGWLVTTTPVLRVTYRTIGRSGRGAAGSSKSTTRTRRRVWWVRPESTAADNAAPTGNPTSGHRRTSRSGSASTTASSC